MYNFGVRNVRSTIDMANWCVCLEKFGLGLQSSKPSSRQKGAQLRLEESN